MEHAVLRRRWPRGVVPVVPLLRPVRQGDVLPRDLARPPCRPVRRRRRTPATSTCTRISTSSTKHSSPTGSPRRANSPTRSCSRSVGEPARQLCDTPSLWLSVWRSQGWSSGSGRLLRCVRTPAATADLIESGLVAVREVQAWCDAQHAGLVEALAGVDSFPEQRIAKASKKSLAQRCEDDGAVRDVDEDPEVGGRIG